MKSYELIPQDGRKSFYGKALVLVEDDGSEILLSYGTAILKRTAAGEMIRLWDGWSATTGRHIRAFCGMDKKEFMAMEARTEGRRAASDLSPAESLAAMMGRRAAG